MAMFQARISGLKWESRGRVFSIQENLIRKCWVGLLTTDESKAFLGRKKKTMSREARARNGSASKDSHFFFTGFFFHSTLFLQYSEQIKMGGLHLPSQLLGKFSKGEKTGFRITKGFLSPQLHQKRLLWCFFFLSFYGRNGVSCAYNPSSQEAEARGLLCIWMQYRIYSETDLKIIT